MKGFSIVELLIAAGLVVLILGIVGLVYVSSNRSFKYGQTALDTEADLRLAMDWITRDIRKAESISISGSTVTVVIPPQVASEDVVYTYDPDEEKLVRTQGSSSRTIVSCISQPQVSIITDNTVAITLSSTKTILGKQYQRILTSKVTMRNAE